MIPSTAAARSVAQHWALQGAVEPVGTPGLINGTWCVGAPPEGILQWLNPIFSPEVNRDIDLLTAHLARAGLVTPTLVPTREGALWVDGSRVGETGCFRMLSFVPGRTVHHLTDPALAAAGAALIGRWHRVVAELDGPRHAPIRRIHDTAARMADLQVALDSRKQHTLFKQVEPVAHAILSAWDAWDGPLGLPERPCHGDLKISNLRFATAGPEAVCLIDLDTIGPQELACELGDLWRSWCNPAGEDAPEEVVFDLALFEASARAWLESGPDITPDERQALETATPRICLELAARFAADALLNSYFREDRSRFAVEGAHNLHRARAQLNLAAAATDARLHCARILSAH